MNSEEQIFNFEKRRVIYNYILKHPGIHLSDLCRRLKIPKTTMFYHLNYLKKNGLVTANITENYSCYYIPNKVGRTEKKILNLIKREIPQYMILMFIARQCLSRMEISKELEVPPNTIDYYLKKLLRLDVIEPAELTDRGVIINWHKPVFMKRKPVSNEVIYRMKSPFLIYKVLVSYKSCFAEENLSLLCTLEKLGFWEDPDEVPHYRKASDNLIDFINEMLPIPFCA